jgi:hypothetical protein
VAESILEALRKSGPALGQPSYTQQAKELQAAKAGKQGIVETGPGATNLSEQVAKQGGEAGLLKLAGQQELQQIGTRQKEAALEQQSVQQTKEIEQQKNFLAKQTQRDHDAIYNRLLIDGAKLGDEEYAAKIEQLSFYNAQFAAKYQDDLAREGALRRLDNAQQARVALQYAVFSDNIDLIQKDKEFRAMLSADQRTFERKMAEIDGSRALQIALNTMKNDAAQKSWASMSEGAAKGTAAGMSAFTPAKNTETTIVADNTDTEV